MIYHRYKEPLNNVKHGDKGTSRPENCKVCVVTYYVLNGWKILRDKANQNYWTVRTNMHTNSSFINLG